MSKLDIKIKPQQPINVHSQQGVALIVVLMVVLLLAMVGAVVARNSSVALDMTTASQVKQLLKQSSDVPLAKLKTSSFDTYSGSGANRVSQLEAMDKSGPINYLRVEGQKSDEYVLCYQPIMRKGLFDKAGKHRLLNQSGSVLNTGSAYYCDLSSNNAYTSKRKAVSTQVAMTRPTVNDSSADNVNLPAFGHMTTGSDLPSINKPVDIYLRSYATSVIPSMAKNGVTAANLCLQKPIGGAAGTTAAKSQVLCLESSDVPSNIQVQDFAFKQDVRADSTTPATSSP